MRAALLALALPLAHQAAAQRPLPIHFEDDHSGSFFHLAATLDLDEPHALLLVDAHSDASAADRSDEVRDRLREVRSKSEQLARIDAWRRSGRVQVFNWIEPLMPSPFAEVYWLAPTGDAAVQESEARAQLDGRLAIEARKCGKLGDRFHRIAGLGALPDRLPLVASIDLDYFAEIDPDQQGERFDELWSRVLALPRLRAITFSVSRPWLPDDGTAHALAEHALRAALSVRNAGITFEPFAPRGPDRSERAKSLFAAGGSPPRYDISTAPPTLRALLSAGRDRLHVRHRPHQWQALLDRWSAESGAWRVIVDGAQPSTDEIWRLTEPASLRVRASPRRAAPREVRWLALVPEKTVYNVLPEVPSGKQFAEAGTPHVRDTEIELAVTGDGALSAAAWRERLDARTGWGALRIVAEVYEGESWVRTPEVEIRVAPDDLGRFRGALAEQFNLPYVFGAGFLSDRGETGPETRAGNDCANFLAYAWRRCGRRIGWCDPLRLRRQLSVVAEGITVRSRPEIGPEMIDRGLVVHCGKHVAAVWRDTEPIGVLDADDLVTHHLSGAPEIITLKALIDERPGPEFDLLVMPENGAGFTIVAGGDICLAPDHEPRFPESVARADLAVANLECALTGRTTPRLRKRYLFRAPPSNASSLAAAGFDALSVANNHARDFGDAGEEDSRRALEAHGVATFDTSSHTIETPSATLSLFGINYVENEQIGRDASALADNIAAARAAGITVIVFPHWGEEFTGVTTSDQREQARWLVDLGADAVIGAGPHRWQPLDFYRGRPIFYSLGNAYFPPRGAVPEGFHEPHWAHLVIDEHGDLRVREGLAETGARR